MSPSPASVSVIVTRLDRGHYLRGALESIATASTKGVAVEIVVVAQGSNDANVKRLVSEDASLRGRDRNFKWIQSDVAGASAARNAGARAASGDYVIFLDADGLLSSGTIDVRRERIVERSADLVVTNYLSCNEEQNLFWAAEPSTVTQDDLNFQSFSRRWERGVFVPLAAGLFRRDLVLRLPFDEDLQGFEAWLFWMRLLASTEKAVYVPTIGCVQRAHADNTRVNRREMALSADWIDAAARAARDIPRFGETERRLAWRHWEDVRQEYFRQAFGSSFPERFHGALFADLAAMSGE